jgi:hypothetical protein
MAMCRCSRQLTVSALLLVSFASSARAQQAEQPITHDQAVDDRDHAIVYELGLAGDWSRTEGLHPGGTAAFEVTPIEHWLELEFGFTAIRADTSTEMPIDVLFKKPWQISRTFEFMIGVGPELIHATGRDGGTYWGVSSVLDFMFWPKRNVGWYFEPGYEVTFRDGTNHRGLGMAAGVLIGR